jgi:hypothetical protein
MIDLESFFRKDILKIKRLNGKGRASLSFLVIKSRKLTAPLLFVYCFDADLIFWLRTV